MVKQLRYYQTLLLDEVERQWSLGYKNVGMIAPTGAGKTVPLAEAIRRHRGAACAIAHRDNLVIQLSLALAEAGVKHRLIASEKTQKAAARAHVEEIGQVFLDPLSRVGVASAQTLAKRENVNNWCASVTLWVIDEIHHLTSDGIWGKCVKKFTHPQCKGLGPTATLGRADGKGLGSHHDGFLDCAVFLVEDGSERLTVKTIYPNQSITCAPAKVLISQGYLTPYKVACVESHLTEFLGEVAASGDWSQAQLKSAAQKSSIIGDVVHSYKTFANGKVGITFATDVETAGQIAAAYREAGVRAEVLTGETEAGVRREIFKRLKARTLQQVVAVDVISEGTDIPAIEVVTFARPTASLGLFLQMLGRALRLMEGKAFALLIDHVGNFLRHRGGPDTPRTWSLDRRDKRAPKDNDAIPIRVCLNVECGQPYEKHLDECPFCGQPAPEPEKRGPPDMVEGVLTLMDDETLARLRGEEPETEEAYVARLLATGLPGRFIGANVKKHREHLSALSDVEELMAAWGGIWHARGESDTEIQRRFWYTFGMSVLEPRVLSKADAEKLLTRLSDRVIVDLGN